MKETLYFAYGSNINLSQMANRCRNATVVGPATLENYSLRFRGNRGGYGVATVVPEKGSRVEGLLWKPTPECEKSLDIYEGYPILYGKEEFYVTTADNQEILVMAYVMQWERRRWPAMPTKEYFNGILEGFRQNGLPENTLREALKYTQKETQSLDTRDFPKKKEHER